MATIRITRYEIERNLLPAICVVTGEPTSDTKRHKFRWTPPWVAVLILAGVVPYAIVAMILRKEITVEVPIASRKRGHWLWRQLFTLFGVLGCLGLVVAGIALSNGAAGANQGPDFGALSAAAAGVGLLLVLIVAVILQNTSVRPKEITDRDITLTGVHENFLVALEDERDRDEEVQAERKAERRERQKARGDGEEPRRARRSRDDD